MLREIAPAKINLYLHVGGLRADGLHDLASIFVFADIGDLIEVAPADDLSLSIDGEFAEPLKREPVERNLVWRAADALRRAADITSGARIRLIKNLPIAAGIGGGSADAAAALRALTRLWRIDASLIDLPRLAFALGADVPACLSRSPVFVSGAGETLTAGPSLPPLWVALVNPRVETPTGPIFRAFDAANPAPAVPVAVAPEMRTFVGVCGLARHSRNDLEPPAFALQPVIGEVSNWLATRPGAIAARMSGSGATTFGLFSSLEAAKRTAVAARSRGWWAGVGKIYSRAP